MIIYIYKWHKVALLYLLFVRCAEAETLAQHVLCMCEQRQRALLVRFPEWKLMIGDKQMRTVVKKRRHFPEY